MRARVAVVVVAAALCWGCASGGGSASGNTPKTGSSGITAPKQRSGGQDLILESEISSRAGEATNALQVVQKLRPAMLGQRQIASLQGQGGMGKGAPPIKGTDVAAGQVVVYLDGTRLGDVEQLRGITALSIATLRYYSASEAQLKWGSNHFGGVIEVISKN